MFHSTSLSDASFQLSETVVPAVLNVLDPALNPNTTYYYKVSGFNRLGDGALSAPDGIGVTRPQRPIGPRFEAVYSSSLTVSWNTDHEAGSLFTVDLSQTADFASIAASTTVVKPDSSRFMVALLDNLDSLTTYYARVLAVSSIPQFPQVAVSTISVFTVTLEPVIQLPQPVITSVQYLPDAADWGTLRITWDPVTLADSYSLERSPSQTIGFVNIISNLTDTTYDDTGAAGALTAGTSYYYRLQAHASHFSSPKSVVQGQMTKPAPVLNWGTFDIEISTIGLQWYAPNKPPTVRYELRQSTNKFATPSIPRLFFSSSAVAGLLAALTPNTSYPVLGAIKKSFERDADR